MSSYLFNTNMKKRRANKALRFVFTLHHKAVFTELHKRYKKVSFVNAVWLPAYIAVHTNVYTRYQEREDQ